MIELLTVMVGRLSENEISVNPALKLEQQERIREIIKLRGLCRSGHFNLSGEHSAVVLDSLNPYRFPDPLSQIKALSEVDYLGDLLYSLLSSQKLRFDAILVPNTLSSWFAGGINNAISGKMDGQPEWLNRLNGLKRARIICPGVQRDQLTGEPIQNNYLHPNEHVLYISQMMTSGQLFFAKNLISRQGAFMAAAACFARTEQTDGQVFSLVTFPA